MHSSIVFNPARQRWGRAIPGLAGAAAILFAVLCQAQTSSVPTYTITTVAGSLPVIGTPITTGSSGDGGPATSALLNTPSSVALDSKGNLYIVDQGNNKIRKVTSGTISTVCCLVATAGGPGTVGYTGDGAAAISAEINNPDSLAFDSKGNYYFTDTYNGAIRMVNTAGVISSVAGSPTIGAGYSGDGNLATSASLDRPAGIAIDSAGNIYFADNGNDVIREVTASNMYIQTIVGDGTIGYSNGSGSATSAHLDDPRQVALDGLGNLYFADTLNNQIRKVVLSTGTISLVAGSAIGAAGYIGDGGLAANALLDGPTGVAVDTSGNVYICDTNNDRIRLVTTDGYIHTIAGSTGSNPNPGFGGDGGPALSAQLDEPVSIFVDSSGNLYVVDVGNEIIRKLVPSAAPGGPGPAPSIRTNPAGVISLSGFGGLASVAPGSWIEIYGSNLAPVTPRQWQTTDFQGIQAPTQLNQTSVSIGGQSAFVEYVSPVQVNAQVPGTIGLGTQLVTVSTPSGTSAPFNVNVNLEEPALYAPPVFSVLGQQCVGAQFTDLATYVFPTGSFAGIPSRPAKAGDTIVLYGIGFGAVPGNPPGQIPQAANGLQLPPSLWPNFYFNGVPAQVSYAGLSPGFIGEYQFNVVVPSITVPSGQGCTVPLTFNVNVNGTVVSGTQTLYTSVQN